MKKVLVFVTILTLVASFGLFAAAQAEAKSQSNEVTLYYSHSADWTDPLIKEFQDRTGIKVNLVGAPTGELVARIRAEKTTLSAICFGAVVPIHTKSSLTCSNRMSTRI